MKYYVSTGNMFVVIAGNHITNSKEAAIEACLQKYSSRTKAEDFIRVSERGFNVHNDDIVFDLLEILEQAGFEFEE